MTLEVLSLQSEGCLDPALVGAKAAQLAAALDRGLPVLPGVVLPVEASLRALQAGMKQALRDGLHAARLEVMEGTVSALAQLVQQCAELGKSLVVRSSSPLEDAADYSGAFVSYLGVTAHELPTAVRGVLASALTEDGLALYREQPNGVVPGMAVLVQPEVEPQVSGTAQVRGDAVIIVVVRGSPVPLLSGWARGETALMRADKAARDVAGDGAIALAGRVLLDKVRVLAIRVRDELGSDLIEWATTSGGRLVLLQAKHAAPAPAIVTATSGIPSVDADHDVLPPAAAGVARLLDAFAGPLGEELVLPIILAGVTAASGPPSIARAHPAPEQPAAADAWVEAQSQSQQLRRRSGVRTETLDSLRGGSLATTVAELSGRPAAEPAALAALFELLMGVAAWLYQAGILAEPDELWTLEPDAVGGLIATGRTEADRHTSPRPGHHQSRRRALVRWEPVIARAVLETGVLVHGDPASPGVAAGRAVAVLGLPTRPVLVPRMVVVAPHPIPQLAPLMWGASSLVTMGGSTAAHLVEVARSRGVPAVLNCPDDALMPLLAGDSRMLVAVDGDGGWVSVNTRPLAR